MTEQIIESVTCTVMVIAFLVFIYKMSKGKNND